MGSKVCKQEEGCQNDGRLRWALQPNGARQKECPIGVGGVEDVPAPEAAKAPWSLGMHGLGLGYNKHTQQRRKNGGRGREGMGSPAAKGASGGSQFKQVQALRDKGRKRQ